MDPDIPKATLEEVLGRQRLNPDFAVILEFLSEEREELFAKFAGTINEGEVMKTAGAIAEVDRVLAILRGS